MASGQEAQVHPVSATCSYALLFMHRGVGTVWRPLPQPLCPLQATSTGLRKQGHAPSWRGEALLCGPRGKEVFKQFLARPWSVDSKLKTLTRVVAIAVLPLAVLEELNWHISTLGEVRNQLEMDLCGQDTRPGMTVKTTPTGQAPEGHVTETAPPSEARLGDTLGHTARSASQVWRNVSCP